jgi:hypothetical protein
MRLFAFIIFVSVMLLATCSAPGTTPAPVETEMPALPISSPQPTNTRPSPALPGTCARGKCAPGASVDPAQDRPAPAPTETAPSPKLPAASFESETYINEEAGFALDYPAGWTVNEIVIGPRGTQVQFLSSPEIAELAVLPEGETRVNATIYQWDPKNDLAAYVAKWKTAWEASGFTILEEEQLVLEQGLPAVKITVQTTEANVVFLVTALADRYLVLGGEGNMDLVQEIVQRLRPISVK